jgi:uncharacterized surface protein with fasciclin (FAS1) repeats
MNTSFLKSGLATLTLFAVVTSSTFASDHHKEAKEAKKDIIETAVAAGNFKTLATALTEADLVETLKGKGPFTVFAPTDEAFAKVPKADLDNLLKDKDQLKKVLLYHVVAGKVMSPDVVKLKSAKVVAADVEASNGVIHVIDSVIMPPSKEKKTY